MKRIVLNLSVLLAAILSAAPAVGYADEKVDSVASLSDSAVARIIDCREPIRLIGVGDRSIKLGTELRSDDTIEVSADGYCALIFRDGTVRKYDGPKSIHFDSPKSDKGESIVKKMANSIVEIFFASDRANEDAQLGTRDLLLDDPVDRVPRLVYPPDGTVLLDAPTFLKWRYVEGVTDYSVLVYEGDQLVIDVATTDTSLKIDPELYALKPGAKYIWRVKGVVGDSYLRSKPSSFELLDEDKRTDIVARLSGIDDNISDIRLARMMKAQLYHDLGLRLNCYWELESILSDSPDDATALRAKADVLYEMGLVEEALATYREFLD